MTVAVTAARAPTRIPAGSASAFLAADGTLRRRPRAPSRPRPARFEAAFEDRALVYDCFWHADGERVLMVGPPPLNLAEALGAARFTALPSGAALEPVLHVTQSVMVIELRGAPADTRDVLLEIDGQRFELAVGENFSQALAGRRLLYSMNRDNRLEWIAEWAGWHADLHGTDAVVLFDNGSTAYSLADIEAALAAVPGLKAYAVISWPHRFGTHDPMVVFNRFWARFLQLSSMSVVLRRFGAQAYGILNCDVDELVALVPGSDIYEVARRSAHGLVRFAGQWIEPVRERPDDPELRHSDFRWRLKDFRRGLNAPKWVLDPSRDWVADLGVHPHWHKIKQAPKDALAPVPGPKFWHFKGISTNWKDGRNRPGRPDPRRHEVDPELAAAMAARRGARP